jgi:hypothetical protein
MCNLKPKKFVAPLKVVARLREREIMRSGGIQADEQRGKDNPRRQRLLSVYSTVATD